MDILFCDRCHESIPDADLETGKAVRVGGRVLHVPCAFRRVLPGPGRWAPVALALLATAGAAYAVVRAERADRPDPVEMPAVWRDRLVEDIDARVRRGVAEALDSRRAALQQDLDTRVQKSTDDVEARMRTAVAESSGKLDGQVTLFTNSTLRRLEAFEQRLAEVADWVKEVRARALRPTPDAATFVPAQPAPASEPAVPPPPPPAVAGGPAVPPPSADDAEAQRRHDDAVTTWIAKLKDANPGVVFSATHKLKELKDLRAVPALVETLKTHKDFYSRLGAAVALGELKACDAVVALLDALDDKEDLVQQSAAEALTTITGQDPKFTVGLTKKERKAIKDQWARWWKENEAEVRRRLNQPAPNGKTG
jgi:hypothetical protein